MIRQRAVRPRPNSGSKCRADSPARQSSRAYPATRHVGPLGAGTVPGCDQFASREQTGWGPLVPIAMVMFIIALDTTMLNVAIPSIVADLGTTTSAVQSAVALYSLVMAALMVGAGRVADIVGSKRLYVVGLMVFGVGTLRRPWLRTWSCCHRLVGARGDRRGRSHPHLDRDDLHHLRGCAPGRRVRHRRGIPGGCGRYRPTSEGSSPPPCRGGWRSASKQSSSSW